MNSRPKKNKWTIAVCVDARQKASRNIVEGAMRCVAAHGGANVMLLGNHPCNDGFERVAGEEPDILLANWTLLSGSTGLSLLKSPRLKAAIFFGGYLADRLRCPAATIASDDRQIGETAARVLTKSGLREFAFLGAPHGDRWSMVRRDAFVAALAAAGYGLAADYSPSAKNPDWRRERRRLADWVRSLPKPCGVFAAFDQRARHLLSVCRDVGIHVPRQIQILGADDEEYICENEIPSLSSIAIDFRSAAEKAMRAAFAHLEEGTPLPPIFEAGVSGFTERLSTGDMTRTGERVNRARDIIRRHATEGLSPSDVARRVGGSLRLLEAGFRTVLGRTVAEELRETRLVEAARLLGETRMPIGEIAARVSFGEPRSLANAFRRRFGSGMREWRKAIRNGGPRIPGE